MLQCSVFAQVSFHGWWHTILINNHDISNLSSNFFQVVNEAAYNNDDYFYPQENRNINEFLQYPNDEVEQLNLEKDLDTKHDPTFDEEEP